jgi:hypothetical protein
MTWDVRSALALLVLLGSLPSADARMPKTCDDTSSFAGVMRDVDAKIACGHTKGTHPRYVRKGKKALRGEPLARACRKLFIRTFLRKSTCGRTGVVVCCDAQSKDGGSVVKSEDCHGEVCAATAPDSVGEGCTPAGLCVTTSSSSSTTTTSTTTSTTSTTVRCGDGKINQPSEECDSGFPEGGTVGGECGFCTTDCHCQPCPNRPCTLDFTLSVPSGTCGDIRDGANAVIKTLGCGGLDLGGGGSIIPEGPTPDGSQSRFALTCSGSSCTIAPTNATPGESTGDPDCTSAGCNFGTPLPIPNPFAGGSLTTCVRNTWQAAATGTLDLSTGTSSTNVPLVSDVYLTGNLAQPCPRCSASGTVSSPATGTCDRGPRAEMACATTSSTGLTRDCPTGGVGDASQPCTPGGGTCIDGAHVGEITVDLSPLTTGSATRTDPSGLFCPDQGPASGAGHLAGCFGSTTCRTITETGAAAGPITLGTPASATLASVFCVAATHNGLVDASADLPGPGAVSLPGTFVAR